MDKYIKMLEVWFGKLPNLPKSAIDILVKTAPWFALVFGVLGVLASLAGLGIMGAVSPFLAIGGGMYAATGSLIGTLLGLVSSILSVMAFSGLKAGSMVGWKKLFWSEVLGAVGALASFAVGSAIVSLAIGLYILFQIKSSYKAS